MVIKKDNPHLIDKILKVLNNKGVVIAPCDTIYGFIGIVPDTDSKIRSVKGRGETKPFLQLIHSADDLQKYSHIKLEEEFLNLWPGPLTLVVPDLNNSSVAIRVPNDDFLSSLLSKLNKPIYSTSVNRSGQAPMGSIKDIINEFESDVDLIIDAGDLLDAKASTIVSLLEKPYKILRQGSLNIPQSLLG